ncbi:MAG: hypothetical protein KGL94_07055 [Acidobacteriota bacterium]|nr:hypothetical protein [Acidobacteriota bacterium]
MPGSRLAELEGSDLDLRVALVWLVRDEVGIDEDELGAARRRAMFVLAAGGDPHRELDDQSVAAERLAGELDSPDRRRALAEALDRLMAEAEGLPAVTASLGVLRSAPDLAWRSLALALLADEIAGQ